MSKDKLLLQTHPVEIKWSFDISIEDTLDLISFCFSHMGNYTTDVIAKIAFGLELNTLKEKDSTFVKMATRITTISQFAFAVMCECFLSPINYISLQCSI